VGFCGSVNEGLDVFYRFRDYLLFVFMSIKAVALIWASSIKFFLFLTALRYLSALISNQKLKRANILSKLRFAYIVLLSDDFRRIALSHKRCHRYLACSKVHQ
jgi:hypothetical protein